MRKTCRCWNMHQEAVLVSASELNAMFLQLHNFQKNTV